ncbi:preprotein translocase subunit SecG [Patescibacteria group bacterium]|nr:preprotein translocase subunit SecG [Patescibacteria group bacterium]
MATVLASLQGFLPLAQTCVALLIVGAILLQTRGAGLSAFQDSSAQTFYKRRGGELFLFQATIVLGVVFVLLALASLIAQ